MSDIHVVLTGGTIDKVYNPSKEINEPNSKSIIPDYIQDVIKPYDDISFETICLLDSMDITPQLQTQIANAVTAAPSDRVLVICGTSRMADMAEEIKAAGDAANNKTVVFTGAMIPLKEFALSDAGFNLGYALAQIKNLTPGTYVCMNAHTFKAGDVHKDVDAARFVKA